MKSTNYFSKSGQTVSAATMFTETKKFAEGAYARCGRRFYKVLRMTKDGTPVLRLYGTAVEAEGYYGFRHAEVPKGRYARDIYGNLTMKNYTPCKRGPWWKGSLVTNPKVVV